MPHTRHGFVRSVLVSPYFWVPASIGPLLVILAAVGVPALPLALIGAGLAVAGGLALASFNRTRLRAATSEPNVRPVPEDQRELTRLYRMLCEALAAVAGQPEGSHKAALTDRLIAFGVQFRAIASGTGATGGIESWHVAHDAILTVPGLKEYRALVRVRDSEYVRDPAIQESLRATFAAVRRGVFVERILVLSEALWPSEQLLPRADILPWIEEQQTHWCRVILVRERDLPAEPEFALDTCAFDGWGIGTRGLDDRAQTVRVALDFTPATVRVGLDRLARLSNLGIPFGDLLDRAARAG